MKHYAALLFASALLTGCATQAIPPQQAQLPPPSRLMLYQNIPDTPYATVVVVRDSGMLAGSCRTGVYVNGEFAPLRWRRKKSRVSRAARQYLGQYRARYDRESPVHLA